MDLSFFKPLLHYERKLDHVQSDEGGGIFFMLVVFIIFGLLFLVTYGAYAGNAHLPGDDVSGKMEAAGTLLKLLDTALFKWGARLFAGICIMSAAWALKEQRFGIAVICVLGAIIFGTAPKWVKNIFDVSDEQSLFSKTSIIQLHEDGLNYA